MKIEDRVAARYVQAVTGEPNWDHATASIYRLDAMCKSLDRRVGRKNADQVLEMIALAAYQLGALVEDVTGIVGAGDKGNDFSNAVRGLRRKLEPAKP